MTHLFHRDHQKMHVKITFDHSISRNDDSIAKIHSPIDFSQITYEKQHKTAFRLKTGFGQFDLTNFPIS